MRKAALLLLTIPAAMACNCGDAPSTDLPDLPGIDPSSVSVPSEANPCEDLQVSFAAPAYEHDLDAFVDVAGEEVCAETVPGGADVNCNIPTCDDDGNLLYGPGNVGVELGVSNGEETESVTETVNFPEQTQPLEAQLSCSQDDTYLNQMQCSVDVVNGSGSEECSADVDGEDLGVVPCSGFDVDVNAPGTYRVGVVVTDGSNEGEDSVDVNMDYEQPGIATHSASAAPENYGTISATKEDPQQPDGNDSLWTVVEDNFPVESLPWEYNQGANLIGTSNTLPPGTDVDSLFARVELCVDYNGNGEVDPEETNCDERLVEDF